MGLAAVRTGMSPKEYLAFERAAEAWHEYVDGDVFEIPSCTWEHSGVSVGILCELRGALLGRGCWVLTCQMRIKVAATGRYVYPDGCVVCGRSELEDEERDTLLNPRVIIEVLSDWSEAYDRGDKFADYQTIPTLREYVLASQKKPQIEVFTRQEDGGWLLRFYGAGDRVTLASVDCTLEVDRVYQGVF